MSQYYYWRAEGHNKKNAAAFYSVTAHSNWPNNVTLQLFVCSSTGIDLIYLCTVETKIRQKPCAF